MPFTKTWKTFYSHECTCGLITKEKPLSTASYNELYEHMVTEK